jgi:hypothetical protein
MRTMNETGLEELRRELGRLMQEHIESMQKQTFLGITQDELRQERERMQRIREVSADFLEALKRLPS